MAHDIVLAGVTKRYGRATVLDAIDLTIDRGERVAIIGPSGAGKTTLLRLLAALAWPTEGSVRTLDLDTASLRGRRLRTLRARVGLLHQGDNLVPGLRVAHNVLMGNLGRWSFAGAAASLVWPRRLDTVRSALRTVELESKLWALPGALSGGEQQRVALARLLVQAPDIMLADEPNSALDLRLARAVVRTLVETARDHGRTLVVGLHAIELLDAGFDRVVALRDGGLVWQGAPDDLTRDELHAIYGARFRELVLDERTP